MYVCKYIYISFFTQIKIRRIDYVFVYIYDICLCTSYVPFICPISINAIYMLIQNRNTSPLLF